MTKTLSITLAAAILAVGASACGGSKATGITPAPQGGATGSTTPAATTTTSTTSTTSTATVSTPTSGPLSKEPTVKVPKGPAPNHLVIKDLIKGNGKEAHTGQTITVNYVGVLYKNGSVFDASWKRHQTFSTPLANGSVIAGWVKGIPGMKVGGRRELIIPASLAYGKSGQGSIPPNATLIFVVDLLSVS